MTGERARRGGIGGAEKTEFGVGGGGGTNDVDVEETGCWGGTG